MTPSEENKDPNWPVSTHVTKEDAEVTSLATEVSGKAQV